MPLQQIINLPNHTCISNLHQRLGVGGRPALFFDETKFNVNNVTNNLVDVPWGVEAFGQYLPQNPYQMTAKLKE